MGKFLRLSNGIPKSFDESSSPTIYDKTINIVASGAVSPDLNGPVSAGTDITLPDSQTYIGEELRVSLNGILLDNVVDYNYVSSTQVDFLFNLEVGDKVRFFIDRGP